MVTHAFCALLLATTFLCGVRADGGEWGQAAKIVANDGAANDLFGSSVSVSVSTVVVGAYQHDDADANGAPLSDSGAAYVFEKSDVGTWAQAAKLVAADGAAIDQFGWSVSVSGSTIVVGARLHDYAGLSNSGAAYVFEKSDVGTWAHAAKLVAADADTGDDFGYSVSVSGSIIVVGARLDDDAGLSNSGAAYVFEKSDVGTWEQTKKLVADDPHSSDSFGFSVSVSGSIIVIGAVYFDGVDANGASLSNSGAAYVFEKSDVGTWEQTKKLVAADSAAGDQFGHSVSVSGSTIVVGARMHDDADANGAPLSNSGAAYVFEKSDVGTWAQAAKLVAADGAADDQFGWSVSLSGSTVVVGARLHDDAGLSSSGAAYVFEKSDVGTWAQAAKLVAADVAAVDQFGNSVSVSNSNVVVGAPFHDDAGLSDSGAAYVFNNIRHCTCCERSMKSFGFSVGAQDCDTEL